MARRNNAYDPSIRLIGNKNNSSSHSSKSAIRDLHIIAEFMQIELTKKFFSNGKID